VTFVKLILGMGQNYHHPKMDGDMQCTNWPILSFQTGLKPYPKQTKHLALKNLHTASEKKGSIFFRIPRFLTTD
jgi:hypothetical protein